MQPYSDAEHKENRLVRCTVVTKTISDLEIQIKDRDKQIENLQSRLDNICTENTQIKNEYLSIKLYLRSLPTSHELAELQKCLQVSKEENLLLKDQLREQKKANSVIENKAKQLKKENYSLKVLINTKENEIEALQQKVGKWEKRRKAAADAGYLTTEDILSENLKITKELKAAKKTATEKEKYFTSVLSELETKVDLYKMMSSLKDDQFDQLTMQVGELQKELMQVLHQCHILEDAKKDLEHNINDLKSNLMNQKSKEDAFKTNSNHLCELIQHTSKCSRILWRILVFLQQVATKKDADLTLLLADADFEEPLNKSISSEEMAIKLANAAENLKQIQSQLDTCRQDLAKLFGEHLGASVADLCIVQ